MTPPKGAIAAAEFAAAMAPFAPFEPRPGLAVALSGGRDSTALALLAAEWAAERGGSVLALTVDHGLRPESAAEAAEVGRRMGRLGIAHRVLRHVGPRPRAAIQEAAREIRYRLLEAACRAAGILHLLVAHHRDDQAETLAIRHERGSGPDGLAGMAPRRETAGLRLLRPFLDIPRARLTATLLARGQSWIDDPSNDDPRFRRAALRQVPIDAERLLATQPDLAARRAKSDRAVAAAAADAVWLGAEGYALLDAAAFAGQPPGIRHRLLHALLCCIGGAARYGPRTAAVATLAAALAEQAAPGASFAPCTLGGCRLLPWRGRILVCREPAAVGADRAFQGSPGPETLRWDGRFALQLAGGGSAGLRVGALGASRPGDACLAAVPGAARASLPAIRCGNELVAVPTVGWRARAEVPQVAAWFAPARALAGGPFAVV